MGEMAEEGAEMRIMVVLGIMIMAGCDGIILFAHCFCFYCCHFLNDLKEMIYIFG